MRVIPRRYSSHFFGRRASITVEDDAPLDAVSVVFVHGTWARGSRWPQFERALRGAFGAERVAVQYLDWSGRNTVSARLAAGRKLAELLQNDVQARPSARRFIVAHSHGGTVALLALRDFSSSHCVDGIICLSTPFLLVRPREFSELQWSIVMLGLALTLAAVTIGAAFMTQSLVPVLAGPVAGWAAWRGVRSSAARARTFLKRVSLPDMTNLPLLIVRAPDDEASLTLAIVQGASRLLSATWRVIGLEWVALMWNAAGRLADRFKARRLLTVAADVWIVSLFALIVVNQFIPTGRPSIVFVVLAAPLTMMMFTFVLAGLLIVPFGLVNALALVPFGPGYSIFSPFIELTAETTPHGQWTVVQLPWEPLPAIAKVSRFGRIEGGWLHRGMWAATQLWEEVTSSMTGLQHSATHSNGRAITATLNWMQQQVPSKG